MTLLSIIAVLATSGWVTFTTFQRFERRNYPMAWRGTSVILAFCGVGLGVWFLTHDYHTSPTVRATGYPFPIGASEFIDGRWVSGLVSSYLFIAFVADIAAGLGICLLPLRPAQFIFESKGC